MKMQLHGNCGMSPVKQRAENQKTVNAFSDGMFLTVINIAERLLAWRRGKAGLSILC
jgi:hypothetical protein